MGQTTGSRRIGDFGFYIVVIFVAIVSWGMQSSMTSLGQRQLRAKAPDGIFGPADSVAQLNNIQERQLDAYLEVNRLLTTFGTTLLGALGFLLFGQRKRGTWTQHRWAAYIGVLFVAISIFFGYVAYLFVLQKLRDVVQSFKLPSSFDLTSSSPHWAQQAHFYTFLAAVVFVADFVFHNLAKEGKRENPRGVTGS